MSDTDDEDEAALESPEPAAIEVTIDGKPHQLSYEQAFALGCKLIEKGAAADAAKLFERLGEFADRGPRAFIMQAFCEAAAMHFDECSRPLTEAFAGEKQPIAGALHNAFISYHVGIREDALKSMAALVNQYQDLPTLCLLLGDMLETAGGLPMARKCWSLAVHRDREGGEVGAVAIERLRKRAADSDVGEQDAQLPDTSDQD